MRKLLSYWYIPALALLAFLGYLFKRSDAGWVKLLQRELEAIGAGAKARQDLIDQTTTYARAKVEEKYAEVLKNLEPKLAEQAKQLKADPVALAKMLARLAK